MLRPHLDHVTAPLPSEQQEGERKNCFRAQAMALNEPGDLVDRPDVESFRLDRVYLTSLAGLSLNSLAIAEIGKKERNALYSLAHERAFVFSKCPP